VLQGQSSLWARASSQTCPPSSTMSQKIKEGVFVWVKDKAIAGTDFFAKGRVVTVSGNKVTVETSSAVKTQVRTSSMTSR
jgi:hypothetical protein